MLNLGGGESKPMNKIMSLSWGLSFEEISSYQTDEIIWNKPSWILMVSSEGGVVKKEVGEKDKNVLDRGNKRKMWEFQVRCNKHTIPISPTAIKPELNAHWGPWGVHNSRLIREEYQTCSTTGLVLPSLSLLPQDLSAQTKCSWHPEWTPRADSEVHKKAFSSCYRNKKGNS